jgi:hypothetical protein
MLRRHKRLVGALVLAPYVWAVALVAPLLLSALAIGSGRGEEAAVAGFGLMALVGLALGIANVVLGVWFIVDACTSPHVPEQQRVIWILLLLLCNVLAMPFYWHQQIWREPPAAVACAPAAS